MPPNGAQQGDADLAHECKTFTRYLTGRAPDEYVLAKYASLHAAVMRDAPLSEPIDVVLLRSASSGPMRARAADAYASVARRRGSLRRKLVLMCAILENSAAFHRDFTSGGGGSFWLGLGRIAASMVAFALALATGLVLFAPRHLWSRTRIQGESK
jgi:hypothetical protein